VSASPLAHVEPGLVLHLKLRDVPVTVRTDSAELLTLLRQYFDGFITPEPEGEGRLVCALKETADIDAARLRDLPRRSGKPAKESYYDTPNGRVVVKKRTGMVIYSDRETRVITGDVVANVNQVINAVQQVYMEEHLDRDFFLLHAAAVASPEGTGVLIASPSGLGKSSAALATMDCGCRFMSNDRVLVTLTPTSAYLVGVPKKPRINPGTVLALPSLRSLLSAEDLDAYSRMDRAELWNLESKLDADVEQLYGSGSLVLEAPLRLVFLLAWTPNSTAEPRFQEATEEEAVERLSQQLVPEGPYRQKPQPLPGKDTLRAMLRHVRTYVVTGGVNLGAFASFARQVSSEEQL